MRVRSSTPKILITDHSVSDPLNDFDDLASFMLTPSQVAEEVSLLDEKTERLDKKIEELYVNIEDSGHSAGPEDLSTGSIFLPTPMLRPLPTGKETQLAQFPGPDQNKAPLPHEKTVQGIEDSPVTAHCPIPTVTFSASRGAEVVEPGPRTTSPETDWWVVAVGNTPGVYRGK